jgi:hypothetical protein
MKGFVFAYLGGLAGSIPAYAMFSDVGASVSTMTTNMQTVVFLMAAQVGCTLGVVWG